MVSRKRLSEQEFLASVRQYWSNYAVARETDGQGQAGCHVLPGRLQENAFYHFDSEAMGALRHAIEDLALEEANGRLLSTFSSGAEFEPHRERYAHLAVTVERLEVVATGPLPRRVPHLHWLKDTRRRCYEYRLTLYDGKRHQAMALCRRIRRTDSGEELFEGFYSFTPELIRRVWAELLDVAAGRAQLLREFHRLRLTDQVSKQIKCAFAREGEALEAAMQRLLLDGRQYQAAHFASDLERGLARLTQWKQRVPEIFASVQA